MFSLRKIIFLGFITAIGLMFNRCVLPQETGPTDALIHRMKALVKPHFSGDAPKIIPQGIKSRLYLDTATTPPLIRYIANGEEARLFGLNYEIADHPEQIQKDLATFRELGATLIRVDLKEMNVSESSPQAQRLHYFLAQAESEHMLVHLAFTHPQSQISAWMHLKNNRGKLIKDHPNIGLIEIPSYAFPQDAAPAEAVVHAAQRYYSSFIDAVRGDKIDHLIAAPMPVVSGPNAEKFRAVLAETSVQVVTFAQNFEKPEDLKINSMEQVPWLKGKAKAVHSSTWKPEFGDTFMFPTMAQKWRDMGVQLASALTPDTTIQALQYAHLAPQKMLAFKAAARTFQLTSANEQPAQYSSGDDVVRGPWSAAIKSGNAMIFRDETSLMFAGASSDWQPFKDLPKDESLTEVSCVGDCPYWRATFSDLDTQNHPGLITLRRISAEDGKPAYFLKIQSWINTRGPASVMRDGWVVLSLKPAFPGFRELRTKCVEIQNPTTKKWERYTIKGQDYGAVGTKNRATGLPYIVVQSGAEYRIR